MAPELLVMSIAVTLSVVVAIYAVLWVVWSALRAVGRGFMWMFGMDDDQARGGAGGGAGRPTARRIRVGESPVDGSMSRVCPNPDCGHVESRAARFCPRCGQRWA